MMNPIKAGILSAILALAAAAAHAAPAKSKKKAPQPEAADSGDDAQAASETTGNGVDRKRFELYLKQRLKKIDEAHEARLAFFAREQATWGSFWTKVRDERRLFEIRITRQTLDLFESLASLDPKDYPTTIANFEKLQSDVIRSFETDQKAKIAEFFAARDARWKQFAADQEKERADFVADAQQGWQDAKQSLTSPDAAAAAPSAAESPAPRPEPAEKKKVTGADDQWR